jgi:hypothetical protein
VRTSVESSLGSSSLLFNEKKNDSPHELLRARAESEEKSFFQKKKGTGSPLLPQK